MLKHFYHIALRRFRRDGFFSFLNILGLTLGIFIAVVLGLYLEEDLRYDKHHDQPLYRLNSILKIKNDSIDLPIIPAPMGASLKEKKSIEQVVRVRKSNPRWAKSNHEVIWVESIIHVDTPFFDMFTYEWLDQSAAGNWPQNEVVISKKLYEELFDGNVQLEHTQIEVGDQTYRIAGVTDQQVYPSHIKFDLLLPFYADSLSNNWKYFNTYTYLKPSLEVGENAILLEVEQIYRDHMFPEMKGSDASSQFRLQAIDKIHLNPKTFREFEPGEHVGMVWVKGVLAVFLLLLAGINYISLITARISRRSREVAIKKSLGASNRQIFFHFLGESILLAVFSLLLALVVADFMLPWLNQLTGHHASLRTPFTWVRGLLLFLILLVTVVFGGLIPAQRFARLDPSMAFARIFRYRSRSLWLRKVAVSLQWAITIILIVSAGLVYEQVQFIRHSFSSFDPAHTFVLRKDHIENNDSVAALISSLKQIPSVEAVSSANFYPGMGNLPHSSFRLPSKGTLKAEHKLAAVISADSQIFEVLGLEWVQKSQLADSIPEQQLMVVNETMADLLPPEALQRMPLQLEPDSFKTEKHPYFIEGVIKNTNFNGVYDHPEPLVIFKGAMETKYLLIHAPASDPNLIQTKIKLAWSQLTGNKPVRIFSVKQAANQLLKDDLELAQLLSFLAVVMLVLACLGLLGLAVYVRYYRKNEANLPRAWGRFKGLIKLVRKDFAWLMLIALVAGWPISLVLVRFWLQTFPEHIRIQAAPFILSFFILAAGAVITLYFPLKRLLQHTPPVTSE